ncbi:NAD-dependent epimerase/dehydratase family protein [Methyloceanibacter caenitepidi]|uniref:UDP-glucose 4-epimerase n=1 Tax=Methyloceanibacter caenitepidi TaxID=1384459 RepID=A0A0A8K882_9HYPH|nr:NAD-dependent epimerase/dehydratase family protein [Methyloceanibacter caenitepidi]BAQ18199.1 UDP-glucose 4-epimerase [Methyloceanibacter caenitepidi]
MPGAKAQEPDRKPLVALTGATGFIGQHLLQGLTDRGYRVRVLLRRPTQMPESCASVLIGDIAKPYNMSEALAEVDAVIHTAGIPHAMTGLPEDDYRLFNTDATVRFAKAAKRARVKRFLFLSSIRAQSGPVASCVLTEDQEARPTDAYGRSKLEAERGVAETGLDWAALRLALVYGPGAGGNVAKLVKLARAPYPLPLAGLKARHSLLALDNLVEAVDRILMAPAPLHRPFIVADPTPVTVAEMVRALRSGLGRRAGLFYVPPSLLKAALAAIGPQVETGPLFNSLVADTAALRALNWAPPIATQQGLAALARQMPG